MAFCKFSSSLIYNSKTDIDNIFINDLLPYAPDNAVKVYLYGLYLSKAGETYDNNIDKFATILNLTKEQILDAFKYWEEQGAVKILNIEPIEIIYLPLSDIVLNVKKYKPDKYQDFNLKAQEILENVRMIMPREYSEYYNLIENFHIEPAALLLIIKYCVDLKGKNAYLNYILAVAKAWANENITTVQKVDERLKEFDAVSGELKELLKSMSISRMANVEERAIFVKWTNEYNFSPEVINFVAKKHKKLAKSLTFEKLNALIEKYKLLNLYSQKEIEEYEDEQESLYVLAKKITKNLGQYYSDLENIVETYVFPWKNMGYGDETLIKISQHCFTSSLGSLEMMDSTVKKLFKLGIVSISALNEFLQAFAVETEAVNEVLASLNLTRKVINADRVFYQTWSKDWGFSHELILYAASLASTKAYPMQYLNNILASLKDQNVKTVE
ncbi:MAG: DnaD domain protein, partial [Clostridia bacterium]|nr:DnaD domain protein [Clostridia bacterium]